MSDIKDLILDRLQKGTDMCMTGKMPVVKGVTLYRSINDDRTETEFELHIDDNSGHTTAEITDESLSAHALKDELVNYAHCDCPRLQLHSFEFRGWETVEATKCGPRFSAATIVIRFAE